MAKTLKKEAEAPEAGSAPKIPNRNEEAVFLSHLNKLRTQANRVAIKKAELDAERSVMNDMFGQAKQDGFKRKELQAILEDGAASRRDLVAEEERRAQLRSWAGLPAGTQADLFSTPTLAQDELFAEGQGYTAGLRGDDSTLPDHIAPNHGDAFLRGYHAGQEKLVWAKAEVSGDAKAPAPSAPKLVADNDAAAQPDAA